MRDAAGSTPSPAVPRRGRGFRAVAGLVGAPLRQASEARGFAVARLLTEWEAIAGPDLAASTRPLRVAHRRGGLGATLTLACPGALAPVVAMQLDTLRARINAAYGYNAISRITLTHAADAAPPGLAEAAAAYAPAPGAGDATLHRRARASTEGVRDADLRQALETLAERVLSRSPARKD